MTKAKRLSAADLEKLLSVSIGSPTFLDDRDERLGRGREGEVHVEIRAYLTKEQSSLLGCGRRRSRNAFVSASKRRRDIEIRRVVEAFRDDLIAEIREAAAAAGLAPSDGSSTFGERAGAYIEARRAATGASRAHVLEFLADYCEPLFDIPLDEVTPEDVEACLDSIPERAAAKREASERIERKAKQFDMRATQAAARTFVSSVYIDSIERGAVVKNPASAKFLKSKYPAGKPDVDPFFEEELERIRAALLKRELDWFAVAVWLMMTTGIRPQEALGAQFGDVSVGICDKPELHIRRAVSIDGCDGVKTEAARRSIPLDPYTVAILRVWKEKLEASAAERGVRFDRRWFICSSHGHTHMSLSWLHVKWHEFFSSVEGVRYRRMYQLRHSFATIALSRAAADVKTISVMMGHASVKVTLDTYAGYIHSNALNVTTALMDALDAHGEAELSTWFDEEGAILDDTWVC